MNLYDMDTSRVFTPAWLAIQGHHPALPLCQFEIARDCFDFCAATHVFYAATHVPGPQGAEYSTRLPGCAGGRLTWDELTIEISGTCLKLGTWETFAVLMHEACHVLDWVRHGEISGHGDLFAAIGAELGMTVRPGWACEVEHVVSLNMCLRARYLDAVRELRAALEPWHDAITAYRAPSRHEKPEYEAVLL